MDIRTELLTEHSKTKVLKIANYIGNDTQRFENLMELFFKNEKVLTQRVAWVMSHCVDRYPYLITPYLERLLVNLQNPKLHVGTKRNTVRVLQNVDLPEDLLGIAADVCFGFLMNINEATAVRAFSMPILYNICVKEPDLANELRLVLEEHIPHGTSGFKSRGKKILKALDKLG